jgi:hypothetical protein
MKPTQHKTVTHGSCLPPEAYIHFWNAFSSMFPKYKYTMLPNGCKINYHKGFNGEAFNNKK